MRKLSKVICILLSLMLLVEVADLHVLAADAEGQQEDIVKGEENEPAVDAAEENKQEETEPAEEGTKTEEDDGLPTDDVKAGEEDVAAPEEGAGSEVESAEIEGTEVEAEGTLDGKITNIQVQNVNGSVEISWKSANVDDPGNSYSIASRQVYIEGTPTIVASTIPGDNAANIAVVPDTATSVKCKATITGLTESQKYTFTIVEIDNTHAEGRKDTDEIEVSMSPPAKVTGFTASPAHEQVILSWGAVSNAAGYRVMRGTTQIYNGTELSCVDAVSDGTFTYTIQAYRKKVSGEIIYGAAASTVITLKDTCADTVSMMTYTGKVKVKAKFFNGPEDVQPAGKVKKGTKVRTLDYSYVKKRFLCKLNDGRQVWISRDRLKFSKQTYTKTDYTSHVKESYVNAKAYSSPTQYLIWTSLYTQRVNIYMGSTGNWKLIRTCLVATGKAPSITTMGKCKIGKKLKNGWKKKTYQVTRAVQFSGGNYFHTRLKGKKNKNKIISPGMGVPKSHGCIRMYDDDIDFIYYQIPKGTTVMNY